MKEVAIIYNRRSQDREDRQQNSIEYQRWVCFDSLNKHDLVLFSNWIDKWYIEESVSAKIEWKRAWFNRMVKEIKNWNVDYIIIDEPKRLSRNTMDSAMIVNLMERNFLKGLITTWRKYNANNTSDIFLLELDLWLAKKDNKDRWIDVCAKMLTALNRGQWLSKAIFWYRNIWEKWNKDVEVIEEEAKIVLQSFIMRSQWKSLQVIANFISEEIWKKWNSERVSKMLKNTKYYWLQKFWWKEAVLNSPWYKPIIWEELFNKANWVIKTRDYEKWWKNDLPRYFMWILKDTEWNKLYPYETKKNIYYHHWANTKYKINVSQVWLFKEFDKHIENYNFPKPFIALSKATLKEYYKDKVQNGVIEL